jgi:hypothetical protein
MISSVLIIILACLVCITIYLRKSSLVEEFKNFLKD